MLSEHQTFRANGETFHRVTPHVAYTKGHTCPDDTCVVNGRSDGLFFYVLASANLQEVIDSPKENLIYIGTLAHDVPLSELSEFAENAESKHLALTAHYRSLLSRETSPAAFIFGLAQILFGIEAINALAPTIFSGKRPDQSTRSDLLS